MGDMRLDWFVNRRGDHTITLEEYNRQTEANLRARLANEYGNIPRTAREQELDEIR